MPFVKVEPMPDSRSKDCLRQPYFMDHSDVSDQHAKNLI